MTQFMHKSISYRATEWDSSKIHVILERSNMNVEIGDANRPP